MLTPEQQTWINHLSDTKTISILPFDETAEEKFMIVEQQIHSFLGTKLPIEHHGATSLGISGQNEIDIYVPVSARQFDVLLVSLSKLFGKPASVYPLQRARFVTFVDQKHIDVFLINKSSSDWLNCLAFESYLKTHADELERYRKLKESAAGLSVREYYRAKTEFINVIIAKSHE